LRALLRDIAGFAGSQYFTRFTTLIKGFIVAKVLGPEGNGAWQHFILISDYAMQAHSGVLPGVNKELGHRFGEGDRSRVEATQNTGLGSVILTAFLMAAGLALYALIRGEQLHPIDRYGLPILGLIVFAEQLNFTYMAILRVHGQIRLISRNTTLFAIANLVVSIALLPYLKVPGLLLAWLATRLATMAIMVRRGGLKTRPELNLQILRRLAQVGFPIFLFQLTRVALRNIDRVLVDHVLTKAQLGIYGLAVTIAGLVNYVSEAIAFVLYPMYLRTYGETRDATALRPHLTRPTEFLSVFLPIVLGFGCLLLHLPILWLLPAYVSSIDVFRFLSMSVALSSLATLPGFYLMAIDRQNALVPIGMGAALLDYFFGRWMIDQGLGLPGVAGAMALGTFMHTTCVLSIAGWHAHRSRLGVAQWIARLYAPVAYFAGIVLLLRWGLPKTALGESSETVRSLVAGALFLAVSLPVLALYEKRTKFLQGFRQRRSKTA
ncbi:MAG TPA: oligosaccharide flippase family protein, partial [bacterium]|nr:oligosaccharide flippase family protein [bacterium]